MISKVTLWFVLLQSVYKTMVYFKCFTLSSLIPARILLQDSKGGPYSLYAYCQWL